jgi:hypothetical protein
MSVLVPVLFFIVFILGIAQSAITLKTYADTKKAQDANYKFSIFTLVFSILGLLMSGFMIYKDAKPTANRKVNINAPSAVAGAVVPQPMVMMVPPQPIKAE